VHFNIIYFAIIDKMTKYLRFYFFKEKYFFVFILKFVSMIKSFNWSKVFPKTWEASRIFLEYLYLGFDLLNLLPDLLLYFVYKIYHDCKLKFLIFEPT
jgi:hypothetical protein